MFLTYFIKKIDYFSWLKSILQLAKDSLST